MPPLIQLQQVHKSYAAGTGQVAALHPLDRGVEPGEFSGSHGWERAEN